MHHDPEVTGESLINYFTRLYEEPASIITDVLNTICNPLKRMQRIYKLIGRVIDQLYVKVQEVEPDIAPVTEITYRSVPLAFEKIFHSSTICAQGSDAAAKRRESMDKIDASDLPLKTNQGDLTIEEVE